MKKILSLLALVLLSCMGAWAQYTWQGGSTVDATAWNTPSNWGIEHFAKADDKGPGVPESDMWDQINISNATGTTPTLEGWNIRMNLSNSTITAVVAKIQPGSGNSCYFNLNNASTLNLTNGNGHAYSFSVNFGDGSNTMNFTMVRNHDAVTVNYGTVAATGKDNTFNVGGAEKTLAGIIVNATLPDMYSAETKLNKIKLATIGAQTTVSNITYNISGVGYTRSETALTDENKEQNIGKYYYEKDGDGNVWLSWVTGNRRFFSVTYTFPALDGSTFTSTVDLENGTDANDACPAIEYFNKTGLAGNEATVSSTNLNFTVQGSWNYPLSLNRVMRLHGHNHSKWIVYESDSKATYQNAADGFRKDCYWYFTYAGMTSENKVKVYLHTLVNDKKVTLANTNNETQATFGNGTPLVYVTNGNGFSLAHSGNLEDCLNNFGGGGVLKTWNDNLSPADDGSRFHIKADQFDSDLAAVTTISGVADSKFLGEQDITVDQDKKNAAISNPTPENVKALYAISFDDCATEGKYYVLKNRERNTNCYVTSNVIAQADGTIASESVRQMITNATDVNAATLWQFVKDGANYKIKHVNSDCYLFNSTSNNVGVDFAINETSAGVFNVQQVEGKWWCFKTKDANEWLHQGNSGWSWKVLLWNGNPFDGTTNASNWSIEEVTTLPFTFNAATAYATFCSPVNLEIPTGVSAYIATSVHGYEGLSSSDDFLFVERLTDFIPANTGVLLIGTAGATVNFPIAAADAVLPNVEANKFVGTTIARQGFAEDSHYGLRLYNGEAVLAKNGTVANVPANKAILPVDATPASSNVLGFRFGEDVLTSVKSATTSNSIEFYDLNGKRVMTPTTGIYVTRDGRKVFVK